MSKSNVIIIDELNYSIDDFSDNALKMTKLLSNLSTRTLELQNLQAVLTRAKNAYIQDLNAEIIEKKSGVDLGAIFTEDSF